MTIYARTLWTKEKQCDFAENVSGILFMRYAVQKWGGGIVQLACKDIEKRSERRNLVKK